MPYSDSEERKSYQLAWSRRPEVIARRKAKQSTPEAKQKRRAYQAANRERLNTRQRAKYAADPEMFKAINKRSLAKHPDKARARRRVANRVFRGNWPPATVFHCTDCEAHASHYHHPDYSRWWWVEPLCSPCHHKIHTTQTHEKTKRLDSLGRAITP